MQILITRPIQDSIELSSQISVLGHEAIVNPLLKIDYISMAEPKGYDACLITSKHALTALKDKNVKLIIVGKHTHDIAISLGFANSIYAGENVAQLKQFINPNERLLYCSGLDITDNLSEFKNITRTIVYKATPLSIPSPALINFLHSQESRAALFFSQRTAEIFINIINKYRLNVTSHDIIALSLSKKIADYLQDHGFSKSYAAEKPELQNIIEMIDKLI